MDSIYASPADFHQMKQRDKIRGLHLLEYFVNQCHQLGIKCEAWIRHGDPKEVICSEVKRVQPDLLVVGSRGLGPFQRARIVVWCLPPLFLDSKLATFDRCCCPAKCCCKLCSLVASTWQTVQLHLSDDFGCFTGFQGFKSKLQLLSSLSLGSWTAPKSPRCSTKGTGLPCCTSAMQLRARSILASSASMISWRRRSF
ncbi:hypothetical protein PVAP13_1NG451119 [Panicum virgatum]|uniref:UspA domain-containing protein n=1 Tax=Panicum virgatum TaxID=38727 RepID=A0A8T0XD60_PANVG|nr:hypothetical protein PVAP13_1NG451119 [Panicum virgatum]